MQAREMLHKIYRSAMVMHRLRKFVATMMALSLLLISSIPAVSVMASDISDCDLSNINNTEQEVQAEHASLLNDWHDCYIDCGCGMGQHLDAMPHQLAPHVLPLSISILEPSVTGVELTVVSGLMPRSLFPPSPPPIII